jgi:Na+-driven multidrug efflux pump
MGKDVEGGRCLDEVKEKGEQMVSGTSVLVSQDLGATFFAKENNIFWAFLLLAFMASKLFTKTRVLVFSEEYNILLTFVLQK